MNDGTNMGQPTTPPTPQQNPQGQSPSGTTILVLGIIGFLCFVTGIIAWVMGNKEIKLFPNDSNVKAGRICGIVSTILAAVGIVIYIIAVVIIGTAAARAGLRFRY